VYKRACVASRFHFLLVLPPFGIEEDRTIGTHTERIIVSTGVAEALERKESNRPKYS